MIKSLLPTRVHALMKKAATTAGFTMIELLVVIAILGILAVAVLSAINPVEQINRGRDTGSRSDAEQLLSAIERFNAFQGYYPWMRTPTESRALGAAGVPIVVDDTWFDSAAAAGGCTVLEKLAEGDTGASVPCSGSIELKTTFTNRLNQADYNTLYAYNEGGNSHSTYVCFEPVSGAFQQEAVDRCDTATNGPLPVDYPDDTCNGVGTNTVPAICLP